MALLDKRHDREDWLKWAIEFARRDIWPDETITVHGPHPGADFMWGEMDHCTFRTRCGIRGIHDVRGVLIRKQIYGESVAHPIVPLRDLAPNLKRWLRAAQRTLATLRGRREAEQAEIELLRRRRVNRPESNRRLDANSPVEK